VTDHPATFRVVVMHDGVAEDTKKLFARHGIPVDVEVARPFPDWNTVLQIDIPSLVIVGPIAAFLAAFAGAAGRDAYDRLKAFLRDARKTRGDRVVLVSDGAERMGIVLTDELPDDALRALFEIDLREFAGRGTAGWDDEERRWLPGWAPTRRADIVGWFTARKPDGAAAPWHLTADARADPVRAVCGADLGSSPESADNPFRGQGGWACMDCVVEAERSRRPA
jgi:hypothetical protein